MKNKSIILVVIIICLCLWIIVGGKSKAPVILYDGTVEVQPGKTKAGAVLDAGFTDLYDSGKPIDSMGNENNSEKPSLY